MSKLQRFDLKSCRHFEGVMDWCGGHDWEISAPLMCCLLFHDLFMFYAAVLSSGDFSYRRNDGEYIGFRSNPQFHGAFVRLVPCRRLSLFEGDSALT